MLATSTDSTWKSVDQVLDALKKDPKSVSIGVQPGSADLINITLLLTAVGIDPAQVRLVTFKGGGPARNAVLGGTVDVGLVGAEGFLPLRSRVVPLMIFNDERLADWADVQTITEYAKAKKSYCRMGSWLTTRLGSSCGGWQTKPCDPRKNGLMRFKKR
jgi:Uncharacterized protein conserved in bacteria